MSIKIKFETAGLAAAVSKAARIAPTKGVAFDKAAGILIEGRPDQSDHKAITVKATNLEVDYLEWVRPLEIEADGDFQLRMTASLLSGFVGGLPIGSGKTVTITQEEFGKPIIMKSGRTQAKINPIIGRSYKDWEPFDGSDLKDVSEFARRIAQVGWATDADTVPLSGVHIDGKHIWATDRYKMVRVPCAVPIEHPVTVPLDVLLPVMKGVEDVRLGVDDRSLMMMPDEYTQIRTVIFDAKYPPIEKAVGKWEGTFDREAKFSRQALRDAVARMTSLVGRGERYPRIFVRITEDQIDLEMTVEGVGNMTDEIECELVNLESPGSSTPEETELAFTPSYFTECLDNTKADQVKFQYLTSAPTRAAKVTDEAGFDAWLAPRKATDVAPVKKEEDD